MASRWPARCESQVAIRGGTVVASEIYDEGSRLSAPPPSGWPTPPRASGKLAILVPVAPPRLTTRAGLARRPPASTPSSVQLIGTGVWDMPGIGSEAMLRGAWYAAPDPARRADFERKYVATYGRPPHRLATLAYDAVSLAGQLARLKPGGDFSAEAITNPNGWSGVDGVFRFLPDGRTERALAVIEIQGDRGVVVSPAPTTFASPADELMPAVLPRAILFDLDDTLIRAYAQPEEAWTRLLHVFAAHLDAHDAAAIERVRVAIMDEARAFWSDRAEAAKWRLDIPGARRLSVRRGLAQARL